ncbi:hypothetical protein AVEN_175036-1 [Araneus ventricosus]|uniref:Mos1 transposase HTH domain-containing protein n=1 Tax=Araneus ventricosus TaxID=182803 RepID=A0A4Y2QLE2_ARAVE|nr:hypothetical protein AVEN_175036-1 [Araneus ventricosus]
MCEGKVRKWVRDFKAGSDNVHDESRSGRPSVITDDMVASVEAKILENRRFTISTFQTTFLKCQATRKRNDVRGHFCFQISGTTTPGISTLEETTTREQTPTNPYQGL